MDRSIGFRFITNLDEVLYALKKHTVHDWGCWKMLKANYKHVASIYLQIRIFTNSVTNSSLHTTIFQSIAQIHVFDERKKLLPGFFLLFYDVLFIKPWICLKNGGKNESEIKHVFLAFVEWHAPSSWQTADNASRVGTNERVTRVRRSFVR